MYGIVKRFGSYDESVIDHRNEQPLAIALATIVVVWMAFGLTFAPGHLGVHSGSWATGAAALIDASVMR